MPKAHSLARTGMKRTSPTLLRPLSNSHLAQLTDGRLLESTATRLKRTP